MGSEAILANRWRLKLFKTTNYNLQYWRYWRSGVFISAYVIGPISGCTYVAKRHFRHYHQRHTGANHEA